EAGATPGDLHAVRRSAVVESRAATHFEADVAANHRHHSHDLVGLAVTLVDGHEIRQLGHAFFGEKACQQDVRLRQVELAYANVGELGLDSEAAAVALIEQRAEDGG